MKRRSAWTIVLRVALLTVVFFLLDSTNFLEFRFEMARFEDLGIFLLLAFLAAASTSFPILRARQGGWRLVLAVFLVLYAVRYFLVGIEAFYLSDILPASLALTLLVNGAIVSLVFAFLAVWLYGRLRDAGQDLRVDARQERRWWSWLWRGPLAGVTYLMLFILSGSVVFQPLALALEPKFAPGYIAAFATVDPLAVLVFQLLRGTLWAVLTIPVIRVMRGSRWSAGLGVALIYALVMAPLNLAPGELPFGIQLAHTVEVFVENFVFGFVVVGLLGLPRRREAVRLNA